MHFSTVALFVVGLACVQAAPAVDEKAQEKVFNDVKKAFEPVATQVRSLFENGEKAIENLGNEAAKMGEKYVGEAKGILDTAQQKDRANVGEDLMERAMDIRQGLVADVRSFLDHASKTAEPMKNNLRSIALSARDAIEMLEGKYLTQDGKELLRSLGEMVKTQFSIPELVAPKQEKKN